MVKAAIKRGDDEFLQRPLFRGVKIDKLAAVMRNRVDVEPHDAPLFAAHDIDKALQYGPLVLIFDPMGMSRSWDYVDANAPLDAVKEWEAIFGPSIRTDTSGRKWYSRFPLQDDGRGPGDETADGWFVNGDPFHTSAAVAVFDHG